MQFEYTPAKRLCRTFKDDCVVRAIVNATGDSYADTFRGLMDIALEMGAYPNHDKVWIRYLEQMGWVKNKPPRDQDGKLIKLKNWCGTSVPNRAVIRNSRHLTAIRDGKVLDEWDCTYRPANSYWTPGSHHNAE